ncbi:unnamed protein product [Angiostrongylus costaricensis]|uniref:Uncharacterized protein n=1 Tax=Angiostrongylus costaricensis TaxID=334426 RepID=A0A0R3PXH5_ANGCS|nr:unnamed protein product [Angiostrongylus costaricensis]
MNTNNCVLIVPLESKYKRGRWQCFDYYDKKDSSTPAKPRITEPAALQRAITNRGQVT